MDRALAGGSISSMRTFCQINSTANMTQCINPPHTCSSLCSQHPTQQMDYGVFNRFLGREVGEEFWGTRTQHIGASNPFAPKSFIGTSYSTWTTTVWMLRSQSGGNTNHIDGFLDFIHIHQTSRQDDRFTCLSNFLH